MSDKDNDNPFEELQKQLQNVFGSNFKMGVNPFAAAPQADTPEQSHTPQSDEEKESLKKIQSFALKPKEIRDYLNRYVIQQNEAKKVLSVAICDHYNHVRRCLENPSLLDNEYSKQNILLVGPTGVGKTYLMRNIARLVGVPFVKADATKFSETGYVGNDVEELVRDLVKAANGNVQLAQYGIIYIDEIDKIASSFGPNGGGKDVSGRGVQINLLKLMEDTEVNLFSPNDIMGQMQAMMGRGSKTKAQTINTRHILFIVSGAFDQLAESVKKRIDATAIGFGSNLDTDDTPTSKYLSQAGTADYIQYGFEPEFIGRVPVRVSCEALTAKDLALILTSSEGSLLNQYREDFRGYGVDFNITDEAIDDIATRAHHEKTGARGLMTVLESLFRNYKFELPSTGIKSFEVTTDTIADPEKHLNELIVANKHLLDNVWKADLARYSQSFKKTYDIDLEFNDQAAEVIIQEALEQDKTIRTICQDKFKDFQHGLGIIHRNTHKTKFMIDGKAARDPDKELSKWVVESFQESAATDTPSSDAQK